MPKETQNDLPSGSSPGQTDEEVMEGVSQPNTEAEETISEGDTPAESPTAEDDKEEPSLADAVRNALEEGNKEQSSSSEGSTEDKTDPESEEEKAAKVVGKAEEEELGEITEEELDSYKPKTRRRVEKLTSTIKEQGSVIESLKAPAESFQKLETFRIQSGLSHEDVKQGYQTMHDVVNDPQRALPQLKLLVSQLEQIVGDVLPDDLSQRVEQGEITEKDALEMSRLRANQTYGSEITQQQQQRSYQLQQQEQTQVAANEISQAVSTWENTWRSSDPDYQLKHARVMERIELELGRGTIPRTSQEAIGMAERIKKEIEIELSKFLPKKQSSTPIIGGGTSTRSTPAPTSTQEAMLQALGQ